MIRKNAPILFKSRQPAAERGPTSDAFINLYLPRSNGTRKKLGAIALNFDKAEDRRIFEIMQTEEGIARIRAGMELDMRLVNVQEETSEVDFDLPEAITG